VLAAVGASLLWGTMYVPYRKAYISGMNPLSFVTVFTIGELGAVFALAFALDRTSVSLAMLSSKSSEIFWLFLGGFFWVIGDIFQQYATKYLGIGRGIPLSNTNQLWGLAWGALVFGELAHANAAHRLLVIAGSLVMILGALAVSTAIATEREHASTNDALERECERYGLDSTRVLEAYHGAQSGGREFHRDWWDYAIVLCALGVFVWLGVQARVPKLAMNFTWTAVLTLVLVVTAAVCAWKLWKTTRFA
jgi:hypothetical protein